MWLAKALLRRVRSLGDGPSKKQLTPEESSHLNNILEEKFHAEDVNSATDSSSHHCPAPKPQPTSGVLRSAERPPKRPRINEVLPKDSKSFVQRDIRDHFAELPIRSTPISAKKTEDGGDQKSFDVEHAFSETHACLKNLNFEQRMMMRIIDHACSSTSCISHRVADMMRSVQWYVTADLSSDQPLDACGSVQLMSAASSVAVTVVEGLVSRSEGSGCEESSYIR